MADDKSLQSPADITVARTRMDDERATTPRSRPRFVKHGDKAPSNCTSACLVAIKQFQELYMKAQSLVGATAALAICLVQGAYAEQPPAPCHPNQGAAADRETVSTRGDIAGLPDPLKDRLVQLADRPHTFLPMQVFAEADQPGQLVQYYLLDSGGFEPNVFTEVFPGINDAVQLSATGGNCGLPTLATVHVVIELNTRLATDPNDPKAFLDVFTDISPLFLITNKTGWYQDWMIPNLFLPQTPPP